MALDPVYMNFGVELAKGFMSNRETAVSNAAVSANNSINKLNGAEQQGYAAVNYSASLEEMHNAEMTNAIARLQAEGQATVEAAFYGTDTESAELQLARDSGKNTVQIGDAKKYARANYRNQRKAIKAQQVSAKQLQIQSPGILSQVITAGSNTYFNALKSGLIK